MSNSTNAEILAAGAIAAFTVDLLIYPLDTLKTRIQSQDYLRTYATSPSRKHASAYAFRGLYQGVGSVIVATLPAAGIFFTVYESAKTLLNEMLPSSTPQPLIHSLASGAAELSSCLVLAPAEVVKQNAQMIRRQQSSSSSGHSSTSASLQAWRMIARSEGGATRRLWTGYTALVARNLPFTAIQFPIFEATRTHIWELRSQKQEGSRRRRGGFDGDRGLLETGLVTCASAAAAGAFAATLTTPSDVVKTRMMLSVGNDVRGGQERQDNSSRGKTSGQSSKTPTGFQVARQVYQEKGIRGLFRGGLLRASWTAVGSGLYLGTYEASKLWLKRDKDVRDGGL